MSGLAWNWLGLPYLLCAVALLAVAVCAAVIRGDRVLRLGAISASMNTVPWALATAVSTWTTDPATVLRLYKLGNGPIALVGPSLLLVLLGASGQLERFRWVARFAAALGIVLLALCWSTDWVVGSVHPLSSGMLYLSPGPLTGAHFSGIAVWLGTGIAIARRSTSGGEQRRIIHMIVAVLALGTIGASDLLLVYGITNTYPIAWLPTGIAAGLSVYYELKSDLLRPQGVDRRVIVELVAFLAALIAIAVTVVALSGVAPVAIAIVASIAWTVTLGIAWGLAPERSGRIASERALEELVVSLGELDGDAKIGARLATLWRTLAIEMRVLERVDGEHLIDVGAVVIKTFPPTGGNRRTLDPEVAAWFVRHGDALAANDLGTMVLGAIRPKLEALVTASGATLIVPLIDRGTLVALVEADHAATLREDVRGLVVESARAAARALTYVALSRTAARERETAREVEVAEAMRLQASASRDDELGRWMVAAEYRTAARTTGAGWSTTLLADGRLAVLVTEAQAHGVPAALATAALTGAFTAATTTTAALSLDDILTNLRASAEGVVRGGEPVAVFVAILDCDDETITWGCAGHPGALLVGHGEPVLLGGGAARGTTKLSPGALLVVASSGLRGEDTAAWSARVGEAAPAGPRLASVLVDGAGKIPREDLLAVVVRERMDRRSEPVMIK
ncbi:MAG: SpoIIE family protein phosphatase [Kofleriaceae bacterium]